jgi:acyl-CoA thioester hydrolase
MSIDTTFHVRYAETDQMGIAHHSAYIVWMEEGRSHYMRAIGSDYAEIERSGYFLAVTEVHARYLAPAHYGERITVRTRLDDIRSRSLTFAYEIALADSGPIVATGESKHVCIDRDGRVATIPAQWRIALSAAEPAWLPRHQGQSSS